MTGVLKARTAVSPDVWSIVSGGAPPTFLVPRTTLYTADGTWTKPAGLVYIDVEVQGGGGGAGGCPVTAASQGAAGGAGGGGGYARKTIMAADLPATQAYVIGAGGLAGTTTTAGSTGEPSSFGTVVGNAGTGGAFGVVRTGGWSANGGSGGTATGGDINIPGGNGDSGIVQYFSAIARPKGGESVLGHESDNNGTTTGAAGAGGKLYGGGGGSGFNCASQATAKAGAAGGAGCVIVTEWTQQVAATGITEAGADALYLRLDGGSMTGSLITQNVTSFNMALADDEAKTFTFASEARGLLAFSGNTNTAGHGLIFFRTGASAQCLLIASAGATVTCGTGTALTGVTGVDGHLTFRTNTANNVLYIENRTASPRGYAGQFYGMTGSGGGFTYVP